MSKNEFDELLLKKLREADFEYNPASWEQLSSRLPQDAPMSESAFDALLINRIQEEEMEYNAKGWEQLAAALPPAISPAMQPNQLVPAQRNTKWRLAAGIAAALLLITSTTLFLNRDKDNTTENDTPALANGTPAKTPPATTNKNTTTPANTLPTQYPQNSTTTASNQQPVLVQQPLQIKNNTPGTMFRNNNVRPLPVINQQEAPQLQMVQNELIPQPAIVSQPGTVPVKDQLTAPVRDNAEPQQLYAYNNKNEISAFYEGNGNIHSNAKTSISLGGGVNYGNLNTGYTAGVTVRRKVAGDFFVDGTVAMMYNNNASNVMVNNGPSLAGAGTASRPSSFNESPLSSPALDPIQKLYYVQFNPSFGYQIEKHVALSVGGDFQQMLNKKEEIVLPESNNSKLFPNFDVGLTTKSEFSITPNIQAGLMYREGLSNLLRNDGSKYVNRRYVQVQFKYNIPVN
ncbi:MAG: hypothetical protein EOP49_18880 [Sphingobacteriales bacterium]|nr:MAG: hypothetical protein EOP49_18880 [Sphingobacteriales bacterium]